MGNFRPLDTKCGESFLKFQGYSYKRTASSHDQWTKKGSRTIAVLGNEKQIPAMHLKNIIKFNELFYGINIRMGKRKLLNICI